MSLKLSSKAGRSLEPAGQTLSKKKVRSKSAWTVSRNLNSTPWLRWVDDWRRRLEERGRLILGWSLDLAGVLGLALVFFASALELSAGAYNPFIYFRF